MKNDLLRRKKTIYVCFIEFIIYNQLIQLNKKLYIASLFSKKILFYDKNSLKLCWSDHY